MKKIGKVIKIKLSIALLFVSGWLLANDTLTWVDCVNYALENNLDIQVNEFDREYQKLVYKNQINAFLPGADASTSYGKSIGRSIDQLTNDITDVPNSSLSFSAGASIGLFQGFSRINRISMEKLSLKIADKQLEQVRNSISFSILDNYIKTMFYQELYIVSIEKLNTSKKELYRSTRLKELGKMAGTDVFEAEANMMADSFLLIQNKGLYETSLMQLKETMNFPIQGNLILSPIENDKPLISIKSRDSLFTSAVNYVPEIQIMNYRLKRIKKDLAIQRANFFPSISANTSLGSGYYNRYGDTVDPFDEQIRSHFSRSYRVSMSIPIFGRWYNRNSIKRTKIQMERMETELEQRTSEVEYEISQLLIDLNTLSAQLDASERNLKAQETVFLTAEKKRENGLISLVDLYTFSNNLATAKMEYSRLKMQLFLKLRYVQFYLEGTILN